QGDSGRKLNLHYIYFGSTVPVQYKIRDVWMQEN
ncbi:hypothetical protein SNEBB_006680, partial [Seison nebaliae]